MKNKTSRPSVTKPVLPRKRPARALLRGRAAPSGASSGRAAEAPAAARTPDAATGAAPDNPTAGAGRAPFTSAVSQGVELGYQVVQRYLEQGEKAARAFLRPAETGAPEPFGFNVDPFRRSAEELTHAFTELIRTFARVAVAPGFGAPPPPMGSAPPRAEGGPSSPGAFRMPGPPAAIASTNVSLSVRGRRPLSVTLSLAAEETRTAFEVPALAHARGRARLHDVRVFRAKPRDPLTVEVPIDADTAAGRYEGAVFPYEGGAPLGRLTVVVGEDV